MDKSNNVETIFMICDEKLDELKENVSVLLAKLES